MHCVQLQYLYHTAAKLHVISESVRSRSVSEKTNRRFALYLQSYRSCALCIIGHTTCWLAQHLKIEYTHIKLHIQNKLCMLLMVKKTDLSFKIQFFHKRCMYFRTPHAVIKQKNYNNPVNIYSFVIFYCLLKFTKRNLLATFSIQLKVFCLCNRHTSLFLFFLFIVHCQRHIHSTFK